MHTAGVGDVRLLFAMSCKISAMVNGLHYRNQAELYSLGGL
jgi:hypothetical protein